MRVEHLLGRDTKHTLVVSRNSFDKGASETGIATAMASAIGRRRMKGLRPRSKVKDRLDGQVDIRCTHEFHHVANQLAFGALDTSASVTDGFGNYRELATPLDLHADIVILAVTPPSYSTLTTSCQPARVNGLPGGLQRRCQIRKRKRRTGWS